jgi:hypothetical protein
MPPAGPPGRVLAEHVLAVDDDRAVVPPLDVAPPGVLAGLPDALGFVVDAVVRQQSTPDVVAQVPDEPGRPDGQRRDLECVAHVRVRVGQDARVVDRQRVRAGRGHLRTGAVSPCPSVVVRVDVDHVVVGDGAGCTQDGRIGLPPRPHQMQPRPVVLRRRVVQVSRRAGVAVPGRPGPGAPGHVAEQPPPAVVLGQPGPAVARATVAVPEQQASVRLSGEDRIGHVADRDPGERVGRGREERCPPGRDVIDRARDGAGVGHGGAVRAGAHVQPTVRGRDAQRDAVVGVVALQRHRQGNDLPAATRGLAGDPYPPVGPVPGGVPPPLPRDLMGDDALAERHRVRRVGVPVHEEHTRAKAAGVDERHTCQLRNPPLHRFAPPLPTDTPTLVAGCRSFHPAIGVGRTRLRFRSCPAP